MKLSHKDIKELCTIGQEVDYLCPYLDVIEGYRKSSVKCRVTKKLPFMAILEPIKKTKQHALRIWAMSYVDIFLQKGKVNDDK